MLIAAGLLLLAILVLAMWTNSQLEQRRTEVETKALDSARDMTALADAEAEANARLLALMADAPAAADRDMTRMTRFFDLTLAANPSWNGLVLRDTASGAVILEKGRQPGAGSLRPLPGVLPDRLGVEGVFAQGRYCPCVVFDRRVAGAPGRVLTLYMTPDVFQRIMQRQLSGDAVGGLVDRGGRFIGRSVDFPQRVGTPGTVYLRRAVAAGGQGIYRGVTFEGLVNYTAYATSPLTGWSGHVAIDRARIDDPRTLANVAVIVAVISALLLAAGLLFYAAVEARRRRRDEGRLLSMQKAEAISRFTSTTVHDFRNILAVIQSGMRLIERRTAEPGTLVLTRAVTQAVERGNRLTNQLLSFVRASPAEVTRVDLEALLKGCDELIGRSLGGGIAYRWTVADDARFARANADQLELALLNLAVNARDAMDGAGTFSIEVMREDEEVCVCACDTGPGVPKPLRGQIFDAFYSTKSDGGGTGLGLAQVAGAARQAGGSVELRDRSEGGACFVIHLPRVA